MAHSKSHEFVDNPSYIFCNNLSKNEIQHDQVDIPSDAILSGPTLCWSLNYFMGVHTLLNIQIDFSTKEKFI